MKIRGKRECRECGTRWSYYETGTVECPGCGSLRSVGVDDRATHTDAPVSFDLSPHRATFGDAQGMLPPDGVDDLKSDLREYVRKRGFIRGGELLPLDTTYLAARELLEAVDCYDRLREPTDADREYLLDLLAGADEGVRPATEHIPEQLREARGMAAARAVDEYRGELLAFLDELDTENALDTVTGGESEVPTVEVSGDDIHSRISPARALLERLRDRTKRVEALEGDVPAADADALVDAVDAIGSYVRTGDDEALDRAQSLLVQQDT